MPGEAVDAQMHRLGFIGADRIDFAVSRRHVAVDDDERCGETLLPVPELFRVDADGNRSAEAEMLQLAEVVLREHFDAVAARRQRQRKFRGHHFDVAPDGVDLPEGTDDDDILLLLGEPGVVAGFPGHRKDPFPQFLPDVRVVAEHPRHRCGGNVRLFRNLLNLHPSFA